MPSPLQLLLLLVRVQRRIRDTPASRLCRTLVLVMPIARIQVIRRATAEVRAIQIDIHLICFVHFSWVLSCSRLFLTIVFCTVFVRGSRFVSGLSSILAGPSRHLPTPSPLLTLTHPHTTHIHKTRISSIIAYCSSFLIITRIDGDDIDIDIDIDIFTYTARYSYILLFSYLPTYRLTYPNLHIARRLFIQEAGPSSPPLSICPHHPPFV